MNKKLLFIFFLGFFVSLQLSAQVKIGGNPTIIDGSALLELESTTQGILIPRMTSLERMAILNPATGLLVYDTTTINKGFYYYDGISWKQISETTVETDPVFGLHAASGITPTLIGQWSMAYSWGNHTTAGYITGFTEVDPIFGSSAASGITATDTNNWDAAYAWGDHAGIGYLTTETDPIFGSSVASGITPTLINQWDSAYSWGNHNTAGYITGFTEVDPVYSVSLASGITAIDTNNWNMAYGWGNHALAGYITTEADSTFLQHAAGGITPALINQWNTAYGWGDHATAGYITGFTELDPYYTASVAHGITAVDTNNWNVAYAWGNHAGLYQSIGYMVDWDSIANNPFDITTPAVDQLLRYDGANWVNFTPNYSQTLSLNADTLTISGTGGNSVSFGNWDTDTSDDVIITTDQTIAGKKTFSDTLITNGINASNKNIINVAQQGIGTAAPNKSAALDITSTTQGFLPPRMTSIQRDSIVDKAIGLVIYNTDCNVLNVWDGTEWTVSGTLAPLAGVTADVSPNPIVINGNLNFTGGGVGANLWSWTGPGAFSSNEQNPVILNAQNFLAGTYTLTASDSSCGSTAIVTVTLLPAADTLGFCGDNFTVAHTSGAVAPVTVNIAYSTVSSGISGTSMCWITQNLGASNQATSATDETEASVGWYWQFNRSQGYKHDGTTLTPSWTVTSISENSDWVAGNDPCALLGNGWRLPTNTEWENVDANGAWNSYNDAYNSVLKLHAAGFLNGGNGSVSSRGSNGFYWSSSQNNDANGYALYFNSNSSYRISNNKAFGFSVRCIK